MLELLTEIASRTHLELRAEKKRIDKQAKEKAAAGSVDFWPSVFAACHCTVATVVFRPDGASWTCQMAVRDNQWWPNDPLCPTVSPLSRSASNIDFWNVKIEAADDAQRGNFTVIATTSSCNHRATNGPRRAVLSICKRRPLTESILIKS